MTFALLHGFETDYTDYFTLRLEFLAARAKEQRTQRCAAISLRSPREKSVQSVLIRVISIWAHLIVKKTCLPLSSSGYTSETSLVSDNREKVPCPSPVHFETGAIQPCDSNSASLNACTRI